MVHADMTVDTRVGRKYFSYGEVLRVNFIKFTRKRNYVVLGNDVRRITHVIMRVSVNLITSVITSVITHVITRLITRN